MKKCISVFSVFVRSSIYKIIPLFVLTGAAQVGLFTYKLGTMTQWDGSALGIEPIIEESKIELVFVIAFLLLSVILSLTGCEFGSKTGYSLRRFRLTEKKTLGFQALYNGMVFALFILFEFATTLLMFAIYFSRMKEVNLAHPGFLSNQTMFLAFFRSDFLHSLLPLQDYMRVVRNLVYVLGFGVSLAAFPYYQRRKGVCFEAIIMTLLIALTFFAEWKEIGVDLCGIGASLFLICVTLYRLKWRGAAYDE